MGDGQEETTDVTRERRREEMRSLLTTALPNLTAAEVEEMLDEMSDMVAQFVNGEPTPQEAEQARIHNAIKAMAHGALLLGTFEPMNSRIHARNMDLAWYAHRTSGAGGLGGLIFEWVSAITGGPPGPGDGGKCEGCGQEHESMVSLAFAMKERADTTEDFDPTDPEQAWRFFADNQVDVDNVPPGIRWVGRYIAAWLQGDRAQIVALSEVLCSDEAAEWREQAVFTVYMSAVKAAERQYGDESGDESSNG